MSEDNTYVLTGVPPLESIPNISLGKLIYDKLVTNSSDEEALVDASDGQSISYKSLLSTTCSLARSLTELGYGRNSLFGICSENCKEFFTPVIASLYLGAIIAPINHNYTETEILHVLTISKPAVVFCSKEVLHKFLQLIKKVTFIEKLIVINSDKIGEVDSISSLISGSFFSTFPVVDVHPQDQPGFLMCSSGTTGLPKGVMLTHLNVITSIIHSRDHRFFNQEADRCSLGVLPFFHSAGMFRSFNNILQKIKIVVLKKFDEKLFLSTIEKYKISFLVLVPPLAIFLAKSPIVKNYDLTSVVDVICGAAPLSKEVEELLKRRLKIKSVQQAYGLTESTIRLTGRLSDDEKSGSSGKLLPYMLAKIRDPETRKSLEPNQVGELCFKGPLIMKGYYHNDEATKNSFTSDGWFLTGDLGYYDEDEYIYIVDRLKELIKYKGFQVAPAELEAILLTNPKIKDAAVVGVPDEEAGELPLAFVVVNPEEAITREEVKKFVSEKVSSPKRLRGGVVFVLEIPKNASGKILRKKLKEMLIQYKSKL